ncbi:MAG: hypothetical protein MJY71_06960 [Bacteroidaceae bacterium]|nr:hypothetical protein [Bacteroidaceae bacterium]
MIPKIIHYCWLSGEQFPPLIEKCIASWKEKLPDYQIKKWDTSNFDINSVPYVKEACEERKWAFAADYIRLYAIYNEGGIYLDSDVFVNRSFDDFLNCRGFSAVEFNNRKHEESVQNNIIDSNGNLLADTDVVSGCGIQAAVIASEKGHPYIEACLNHYNGRHFRQDDGTLDNKIIAPDVLASVAVKFGFRYMDQEQHLDDDFIIYPSTCIGGHIGSIWESKSNYLAIHCCAGSWRKVSTYSRLKKYIRYKVKLNGR